MTRHCYESSLGVLHYLDSGQERAETVVFLHGFTGSSRDFLTLPDQILSHYRCLIPDLPGHGQTQVLEAANTFQTEGQIRLLQQWLTSLEQTRFHLFGYSMGGRLALQFAVRNRQQLDSLMLVSTTAGIHEKGLRQKRAELDSHLAQKILNAEPIDFLTRWLSQPIFQGISEQGEAYIAEEVNRRLPIQPSGLAYSL
ncbi:MAG: alpha/beta fold hydrolase, partial [Pseudanabaenales cyanobacterium]|nr:alpha/beta fold hydrolase [Pseudanabaenales cyanobacterium]